MLPTRTGDIRSVRLGLAYQPAVLSASQPAILFFHTKSAPATSQSTVLFSYNKSASITVKRTQRIASNPSCDRNENALQQPFHILKMLAEKFLRTPDSAVLLAA
jgi:hypothetical protein